MTMTKATNITWHRSQVSRGEREAILNHKGCTVWLTGLPSSGKSTTAFALEYELTMRGCISYVLDGDNVRHGLNKNLGFSAQDREENIRRIGEVARLFADAGVIVIASFISPYRKERDLARRIHEESGLPFIEVFMATPVEVCEHRDPKSLYKKARLGELKGFTGVDDPYEMPEKAELTVSAEGEAPEEIVARILPLLMKREVIREGLQNDVEQSVSASTLLAQGAKT